ncbi:hypothetical protein [Rodentibacter heidelbergensis]|uniref:TauD/TfdA-like domain-containing protein n=1 Tax=Rodentibacter heidelbergensis TaxID=1908258 RepID=A0A1V3IBR2_9PAST|nr:hypothetical protein [Rodentibacter heidelbergensis]OOF37557.1 hypothetical protein BKK48_01105 [Rodentibacter heidelbergensis]
MFNNCNEFRNYFNLEKIVSIDMSYLSNDIEKWWNKELLIKRDFFHKKSLLINLILDKVKTSDYEYFTKFSKINHHISGIVLHNLFTIDSPSLSLLVHESLSDIFNLMDIKYPYEDHKALFLKKSINEISEWGNGSGDISLHSDDLYEDISSDYLSLTTCRDLSNTPTSYLLAKDILDLLTDNELEILLNIEANFISGKNVNGLKSKKAKILESCEERGFLSRFDFRIDNVNGQRMTIANNPSKEEVSVFEKLFEISKNLKSRTIDNGLGTFLIIDNYKVLHARSSVKHYPSSGYEHPKDAFRLLYRSKGPRKQFFDIEQARYL